MPDDCLEKCYVLVNDLYQFRDNYFLLNGLENASSKQNDVLKKMDETIIEMEKMREECESRNRSEYYMLMGKVLNIKNKFDEKAFQLLSKSVKLNPKSAEGWNQLGEAYWKKEDFNQAKNCFEGALKQNPRDKLALRNLSILLRQLGNTPREKYENILKSLEKAKEALDVDIEDGINWYTLGNAYFYLYFYSPSYDVKKLNHCKVAYKKAMNDEKATQQPDFIYNYALFMEYEQDYQSALDYLEKASLLDPSWSDPKQRRDCLISYLNEINQMITKKRSLKTRRVLSLIAGIKPEIHLGPVKNQFEYIKFNELIEGINEGKVCLGKMYGSVNSDKLLTNIYCLLDSEQNCIALSVYNMNRLKEPKSEDSVAICNPLYKKIVIKSNIGEYCLTFIRVENPLALIINGRVMSEECLVRPKVNFAIRYD